MERFSDLKKFKAALPRAADGYRGGDQHRLRQSVATRDSVDGGLRSYPGIDYLDRNLRRFMRPTRRHIALNLRFGSNRIEYQPLGVVGVISPWNYPSTCN